MACSESDFSGRRWLFDSTNGGDEVSENIASDITQLIGWTPLVEIKCISIAEGAVARIVGKLEFYQPLSSVKDRIALKMIEDAEEKGLIIPDVSTLIETSSGNTGIGIALVGIRKGYKVIVVMPYSASLERRIILKALGAEVYLSDPVGGFPAVLAVAKDLLSSTPNSYMLNQMENEMNPRAHFETTGPEIWKDTAGKVDILVAGSGTGGTFSGVGKFLKEQNPNIKVVVVEPSENRAFTEGCKGRHKIEGIGIGFIPATANTSLIDEIIPISSEEAMSFTRRLISEEGLFVGISSGAAFAAALQVAKRSENAGKMIVVILPSGAERYLSTDLFATIRKECQNMEFVPFKNASQDATQTQF